MTQINERYHPHARRRYHYPPNQQVGRRIILHKGSGLYLVQDHGPSFRRHFD